MLDIVQLIEKNPITRLTSNYQSIFINKIKEQFTENQQHLFLTSFYTFLNYHPKNDFVIEFEKIWKWLGYSRKEECKRVLIKHFIIDIDYKIVFRQPAENPDTHINLGGRPKEDIYMNINTFKKLCLKSNTKKADEIHDYFIKMEETFQEVINEESNELKEKLQNKEIELEKTKKQLEKKTKLAVKKWYDIEPGHTVYGYISNEDNNDSLITIGKSKDIKHRESNYLTHNQHGEMFYIRRCHNCDLAEKVVHHILDKYREEKDKEWFKISKELAIYVIDMVCDFLDMFINCSENLPELKIKEFFNNLPIEKIDNKINIIDIINKKEHNKSKKAKENRQDSIQRTGNFKGVCFSNEKQKWKSELKENYNNIFLGYYDLEIDAGKAYNDYALYVNQTKNTKYSLNEIPNYIPTARNIPEDTKQEIIENKSSKYNGVSYDSIRKHYVVSIKFNNKSYHLGHNESEIECAKLYNQQALYYNENFDSKYELNELGPEYEIIAKNVYKELQDNKLNRKTSQYVGCII